MALAVQSRPMQRSFSMSSCSALNKHERQIVVDAVCKEARHRPNRRRNPVTSSHRRYVMAGHAWHSSAVIGVESASPDLNRTMASAVEQKLFVPDDLVMGVATIT